MGNANPCNVKFGVINISVELEGAADDKAKIKGFLEAGDLDGIKNQLAEDEEMKTIFKQIEELGGPSELPDDYGEI